MVLAVLFAIAEDPSRFEDRVEIPMARGDTWSVIPAGTHGVLLVEAPRGDDPWVFTGFGTDLDRAWTFSWTPKGDRSLRDRHLDGDQVVLLFHARRDEEFTLVRVDADDGRYTATELRSPVPIKNTFEVIHTGDDAWVLAHTRKGEADPVLGQIGTVLHAHLGTGKVERAEVEAAMGVGEEVWLPRFVPDPRTGRPDVVGVTLDGRRRTLHLAGLAPTGAERALTVAPDDAHNLINGQRARLEDGSELVLGTYDDRPNGLAAQGLFVAAYADGRESWRRYHSFTSFAHYFDFLPEEVRARVAAKVERKQDAGKDVNLRFLVLVHDLVERGDELVVVAEACYPEYQTHTRTVTTTVNGVTTTSLQTYTVFVGWRYTHAVVAGFSRTGELAWDQSIDLGNILLPVLTRRTRVAVDGERIGLVYAVGNRVLSKAVDGEAVVDVVEGRDARLREEGVRRAWASESAWWHDQVFLVWGLQKVEGDPATRRVLAIGTMKPGD